jgi:hypothetical protein
VKNLARTVQDNYSPPSQNRAIIGSVGSQNLLAQQAKLRPGRALINPFDPSHVTIKLTSNRRRWTHIFPKGLKIETVIFHDLQQKNHQGQLEY